MMLMKGGKTSEKWKSYPVRIIDKFGKFLIILQKKNCV